MEFANQYIQKTVRQAILESYNSEKYVIVNSDSEISPAELPKIFYSVSVEGFVNNINKATIFKYQEAANNELQKIKVKLPETEIGVYTLPMAKTLCKLPKK